MKQLQKKLKFSPVVTIQGARQCGKSTLIYDLFDKKLYVTLDRTSAKDQAQNRTESWLEELRIKASQDSIAIDEAQKAPAIFDQIKCIVDEEKRPGQFILLGSTEFSRETLIQESLTGRVSRLRIYPLTLSETLSLQIVNGPRPTRKELIYFMVRGGFPGVFAIRDKAEWTAKLEEWLSVTCERDVLQIKKIKVDTDLCYKIMEIVSHLEEPTQASIANRLNVSIRKTEANLKALTQIFALHSVTPSSLCPGKTLYFLPDPCLVQYFNGSFHAQLECSILTEFMAKQAYLDGVQSQVRYYRNPKGSRVFTIERNVQTIEAYKITSNEKYDLRDGMILDSLVKIGIKSKVNVKPVLVGGFSEADQDGKKKLLPWENLF